MGGPDLVIDADQFIASAASCHTEPSVTGIVCRGKGCDSFESIVGNVITLSPPASTEGTFRQDTLDIQISLYDQTGPIDLLLRVGYKEFTITSHLTPNHNVDSCTDAVYPFVFGDGTTSKFQTFRVDNQGNILVLGN